MFGTDSVGVKYNTIFVKYNNIFVKYNKIFLKYNKIFVKYNKISLKYNKIFVTYNDIFVKYNKIFAKYNKMFAKYNRYLHFAHLYIILTCFLGGGHFVQTYCFPAQLEPIHGFSASHWLDFAFLADNVTFLLCG